METTQQRMLAILCAKFPKCFFPVGETPKPLKTNIFGAIYANFEPKTAALRNDLKIFLAWYVKRKAYLKAVVAEGAIRVGLNGEQVGIVTEVQRAFTQEQLYQKLQSEADIKTRKKLAQQCQLQVQTFAQEAPEPVSISKPVTIPIPNSSKPKLTLKKAIQPPSSILR